LWERALEMRQSKCWSFLMAKWSLKGMINREEYERVCEENIRLRKLLLEKQYDKERKSAYAEHLEITLKHREE
jgi:hypothetical protein